MSGPVSGSGVALAVTGDLALSGAVTTAGTLALAVTGAVTQPGGTVAAGTLTGSAGAVSLGQAGNAVTTLGPFAATGPFGLTDGVSLTVAGPVSGSDVTLLTGGALTLAGAVTTPGTLTLGAPEGVLQTAGGIAAGTLAGSAGSVALGSAGNTVGTLGAFATPGTFQLVDGQALTVAGPFSAGSAALASTGAIVLAGDLTVRDGLNLQATGGVTQPSGRVSVATLTGRADSASLGAATNDVGTLGRFTTRGDFTLLDGRSVVVAGPVDPNVVTLGVNGDLTVNGSIAGGTVVLNVTGAITQGRDGRITATTLSGRGGSATLSAANAVLGLGDFATQRGLVFNAAGPLVVAGTVTDRGTGAAVSAGGALSVSGTVSGPAVSLTATGPVSLTGTVAAPGTLTLQGSGVTLAGTVSAGTLALSTLGAVLQTGGTLSAGTVTGTAASLDLGRGGPATIGATRDLSAGSTLALVDQGPLRIAGTLAAPFLDVAATGTLTLDSATLRTDGRPLAQQARPTAASPGSTLAVRAGPGGGTIIEAGTTTVTSYSGGTPTLRLGLPARGGTLRLANLQAGTADLVFDLGSGTASGALAARNLTVLGAGGSAAFTGTVRGRTDTSAAQVSGISPAVDLRYTINNCAIAIVACGASTGGTSPGTVLLQAAGLAAIASTLRPDILTLDILDLSVTRDREDPTLLLPNISDRDY